MKTDASSLVIIVFVAFMVVPFVSAAFSHPTSPYATTTSTTIKPACVDSDGGDNIYTAGETRGKKVKAYKDGCVTPSMLQEGICDVRAKYLVQTVFHYCKNGCYMGACVKDKASYTIWEPATTVTESWQDNKTVVETILPAETQAVDSLVKDAVDSADAVESRILPAETEMKKNGIVCADTDGGEEYSVKGDITINTRKVFGDACINPSQLMEGSCDKSEKKHFSTTIYSCPQGCMYGACQ